MAYRPSSQNGKQPANPLQKVFSVLEAVVARQDTGSTYSEIVAALNLPKSSVHRTLKELIDLGYLIINPETKRYFGSLRLAALGAEVMANFQLRDQIRPFLLDLHRETDHTTNLGVLSGMVGVFVDKIVSKDFGIKLFSEIGKTFPLHCTALGKAMLAFSSPEKTDALLARELTAETEKTITDPDAFRREMDRIKKQGFSVDNEEITRGIVCVAAPVFGFDHKMICAISIAFPSYINDDRGIEPEIDIIKRYSEMISGSLGRR